MEHSQEFKEAYNIYYFFGMLVALLLPTLPATLTLIKIFG